MQDIGFEIGRSVGGRFRYRCGNKRLRERLDDIELEFKTLVKVAPFLDEETLEEILEKWR